MSQPVNLLPVQPNLFSLLPMTPLTDQTFHIQVSPIQLTQIEPKAPPTSGIIPILSAELFTQSTPPVVQNKGDGKIIEITNWLYSKLGQGFPIMLKKTDLLGLIDRFKNTPATIIVDPDDRVEYKVKISGESWPHDITRVVQEAEIYKVELVIFSHRGPKKLKSVWGAWTDPIIGPRLRQIVFASADPCEEIYQQCRNFGYKLSNTFNPLYAKGIYQHFSARKVLDPCAGWGDRLIGAMAQGVEQYVGFDPNPNLFEGYTHLAELFGARVRRHVNLMIEYDNSYQMYNSPFEQAEQYLSGQESTFDLVFTSPPYFEYEFYNPTNPRYRDWIKQFYRPLMILSSKYVKEGGFVAMNIDDTSAGRISDFMIGGVPLLTDLRLVYKIGFRIYSREEYRTVWIFQKVTRRALGAISF